MPVNVSVCAPIVVKNPANVYASSSRLRRIYLAVPSTSVAKFTCQLVESLVALMMTTRGFTSRP